MTTTARPSAANTISTLWYVDRSRYKTGTSSCPRRRYLTYHAGHTGYGWAAARQSLPLATGSGVHAGLHQMGEILQHEQRLPSYHEVREIAAQTVSDYITLVEAGGYRGVLSGMATEETIREQATLIEGELWIMWMEFFPWLHREFEVVAVEQERVHLLSCGCGAPPLALEEHLRRGCTGVALMNRSDVIARRRGGRNLTMLDYKTVSWDGPQNAERWEIDPQLALSTLDAEQHYGGEVSELFIVAMNKGQRKKDRDDPDERKRQHSPLTLGYCKPGNPPLEHEQWLPAWEWVNDETGEVKRATRAHRKRGIWELDGSDWATWRAYKGADPSISPSEFWVRGFLPRSVREKIVQLVGPMNRQDQQLLQLRKQIDAEERRWYQVLVQLYESGSDWGQAGFQNLLDQLVPCSWNCRQFGREHECEFVPLCYRHSGWEDPTGSGRYQPRLPHHTPELAQAVARGLLPAEALAREDQEE